MTDIEIRFNEKHNAPILEKNVDQYFLTEYGKALVVVVGDKKTYYPLQNILYFRVY